MNGWITIIDVCRQIGVEPEKHMTWSVGAQMAQRWKDRTGELPKVGRRPKTNGGGSHGFAVYPPSVREEIATLIRDHHAGPSTQAELGL